MLQASCQIEQQGYRVEALLAETAQDTDEIHDDSVCSGNKDGILRVPACRISCCRGLVSCLTAEIAISRR